jgi:DNA polymerase-3 subunit epsilon
MGHLNKEIFICIDCETTGLDPQNDRVIEVAVAKFTMDEVLETFETLVDPQCEIPESSIAIHNITPNMVAGKPLLAGVMSDILSMVKRHTIVGHGIGFDVECLAICADRAGIPHTLRQNRQLDTLRMARLYGESPTNSLEQLRKHFNIAFEGAHRAMNDVIVNMEVFRYLARSYRTLEQLFEVLSRPVLMKIMPLGPHKGRPLKEIPLEYLRWAAHKDFDRDLLFSIRSELKRRKQGGGFSQAGNPFANL